MIPTRTYPLPLPVGGTWQWEGAVESSDPADRFDLVTVGLVVARSVLQPGAIVLRALPSGATTATPVTSSLVVTERTPTRLAYRITLASADTRRLLPRTTYRGDLVFTWPHGHYHDDADRREHPALFEFTTQGRA